MTTLKATLIAAEFVSIHPPCDQGWNSRRRIYREEFTYISYEVFVNITTHRPSTKQPSYANDGEGGGD